MEMEYDNDSGVEEFDCGICKGKGCTVCNMTGKIQIKTNQGDGHAEKEQIIQRQSPKIIINASDYEKDQLITQLGKLRLSNPVASKEYSMALTLYRDVEEMNKKLQDEEYLIRMRGLLENIEKYQIDHLKPVKETVMVIGDLEKLADRTFERIKLMSSHFEIALEIMQRELKLLNDRHEDLKDEYEDFRKSIFINAAGQQQQYDGKQSGPKEVVPETPDINLPPSKIIVEESDDEEEVYDEPEPEPRKKSKPKPKQTKSTDIQYSTL